MVRQSAVAIVLGVMLASSAAGQQSIGVSATILERVEAEMVELEVRSVDGRLSVASPTGSRSADQSRVLRRTFVSGGSSVAEEVGIPVRVLDGSSVRLERRAMQLDWRAGAEMEAGKTLFIESAERLTVTRVVAANS